MLGSHVPACLDADALTLLVDQGLPRRDAPTVLTPHDREFARLAGHAPDRDRVGAALQLASWVNAVVLLKASRGERLERLVPYLTEWATGGEPPLEQRAGARA